MPSTYKSKQPGKRGYATYSNQQLNEAMSRIRNGEISQRCASDEYHIPRSTLEYKLQGGHTKPVGGQTLFTEEEEVIFRSRIEVLCEWGFPVDQNDISEMVRLYSSSRGVCVTPGRDWVKGFMARNNLTNRIVSNIPRKRAQVSPAVINSYFDHLEVELIGIPPENIWNYDETNLLDDPGKKKCVVRRGLKYPERVMHASKVGFSVMFCGNASGDMLPPYTVYKSQHLYDRWINGGPKGARYNRSKSGWFDSTTFTDWFMKTALPRLRRQTGVKALIGDNLSTHLNEVVIKECEKNQIKFICLPPKSTHITQPLDAAYFHPLKVVWRKCLQEWKRSRGGPQGNVLQKAAFPPMLKTAVVSLQAGNGGENLISGFMKTGICPLNRQKVLNCLPRDDLIDGLGVAIAVDAAVMEMLKKMRHGYSDNESDQPKKKKTRITVIPGKSIRAQEDTSSGESSSSKADTNTLLDTNEDIGDIKTDEDDDDQWPQLPIFPRPDHCEVEEDDDEDWPQLPVVPRPDHCEVEEDDDEDWPQLPVFPRPDHCEVEDDDDEDWFHPQVITQTNQPACRHSLRQRRPVKRPDFV
jgi:hypothetical protein